MSATESLRPEDALEFICNEAARRGAESYDAVAGESESMGLDLFEGKVKSTEMSASRGIGIRLFKNNRPGFAFTERLTREAIQRTVDDAMSHTKLTDVVDIELPNPSPLPKMDLGQWNPALDSIGFEAMKSLAVELEGCAQGADPRIENIPYLGVSRSGGYSMVRNSKGVVYTSRSNSVSAGLGVVAKEGEIRKMGGFSRGGRHFKFDTSEMARVAIERAIELLGAEPVPSGEYPVVFSNRVAPQIISMFSSPYFAEAAQKGQSRLKGKVGETIAAPIFNLISDPFLFEFPGSHLFDGEGVVSQPIPVVENGVLRNMLHNLESARKEGVAPTGNGARGYSGKAGTGFANMIVPRGQSTLDSLLQRYPKCLLIVKLEGGSGCSAVSGEISIGAQGFLVEKGKVIRAVDRITLSSNYFELIKNIEGLSDSWADTFSSVKVPDFLVGKMQVAG